MRRAARRDSNEQDIARCARQLGASVTFLNAKDIGDLLIGFRGQNYLVEIKTPTGKQREGQKEFECLWEGQYAVIRNEDELIRLLTEA